MISQIHEDSYVSNGRPYLKEFDTIQYPKGYVVSFFRLFDGEGNPRQHIAFFRANCYNINNNEALLYKIFISSLLEAAFDWYVELPNGSIRTFTKLKRFFIQHFTGAQQKVPISDLVVEKHKLNEVLVDKLSVDRTLA